MKELQILDMNAMAVNAEHFAIATIQPDACCRHVQIPHLALGPAVNAGGPAAAAVTDRCKAAVGLYMDCLLYTSDAADDAMNV